MKHLLEALGDLSGELVGIVFFSRSERGDHQVFRWRNIECLPVVTALREISIPKHEVKLAGAKQALFSSVSIPNSLWKPVIVNSRPPLSLDALDEIIGHDLLAEKIFRA